MPSSFSIDVTRRGTTVILQCKGELDIATVPSVEETLQLVLADEKPAAINLDWSGLTFMDSTGIRLLLRTKVLCRDKGVDLTWSLSDVARGTLDIVGIHDTVLRDYGP
jgi:anti-anti-sigma factor